MTDQQLSETLRNIKFQDWMFTHSAKGDGFLLQVVFQAPDTETGQLETQRCRKWYISSHATTQEVIRTAFKAILAAVEHEACELFTYKNVAIFNPHLNYDDLVENIPDRVYRK